MSDIYDLLRLIRGDAAKPLPLEDAISEAIEIVLRERRISEDHQKARDGADMALSAIIRHQSGDKTFANLVINLEHNLRNSRSARANWEDRYEHEKQLRIRAEEKLRAK